MLSWFNKTKNKSDDSLCLFSCFLTEEKIPKQLKNYLKELSNHFSEIILLTHLGKLDHRDLEYLESIRTRVFYVKNEGYDFGMYYQAIQQLDISKYTRLGLANDSTFLCQSLNPFFKWLRKRRSTDMAGVIESIEIDYHLQSYFIVFQNQGINRFLSYLQTNGIKQDKQDVIITYEVELTQHFKKIGLQTDSFFKLKKYKYEECLNPSFFLLERLLKDGFPMIKKRILLNSVTDKDRSFLLKYGFEFNNEKYLNIIRERNPTFEFNPNS